MSDADLVRQTLAGRTEAFAELVRRWAGRVTALCHAKAGRTAADDLAQETLLRGFRALRTLADPERFGPWLCGIALRTCLDWLKAKERTVVPFSALGPSRQPKDGRPPRLDPVADDAGRADECRRVLAAVEALPEAYRTAVLLYYYDDLTYRELAGLLGVSPATVNARLTKARALLRERLDDSPREKVPCSANRPRP
jgi:RNA polymerase sigma-70 factor (ECF subfamily)